MSMEEFSETLQKILYSVIILCIFFFFYKILRRPEKNFGLLMILILLVALFSDAVVQLVQLVTVFGKNNSVLDSLGYVLNNFASLWIISLAIYHYSLLNFFMGRFREYPFKTFMFRAGFCSVSIAILTELE